MCLAKKLPKYYVLFFYWARQDRQNGTHENENLATFFRILVALKKNEVTKIYNEPGIKDEILLLSFFESFDFYITLFFKNVSNFYLLFLLILVRLVEYLIERKSPKNPTLLHNSYSGQKFKCFSLHVLQMFFDTCFWIW